MAFDGQPVPSTEYQIPVAKISDEKSVVVTATGDVVQGNFYEIEGFFGAAMTNGKAGDKVVLNIEQAEYSTVQVVDGATFSVGSLVYWDGTAFNDVGTSNRLVGRCTSYDSVNKVLTFILGPQALSSDGQSVVVLAAQVGTLGDLTTTAKNSIVAAINELDGEMGALASLTTTAQNNVVAAINEIDAKVAEKVNPIADVENLSVSDATDLQAVATKLNALLTALTNAGLMAN